MNDRLNSIDDFFSDSQCHRWIVTCAICGRRGRAPDSPVKELPEKFRELFPVLTVGAEGVCQVCLPRYNHQREESEIIDLLKSYVNQNGCPCDWQQFEYWVSKEHCINSHDGYQNILAEAALDLGCFKKMDIQPGYDVSLTCKCCGRNWHYTSHEWRMMAFKNKLIPADSRIHIDPQTVSHWLASEGEEFIYAWKKFMLLDRACLSSFQATPATNA